VEAQTDLQTYLEQGRLALAQGQGREAAIAYAHGAQIEPQNPLVHLGLAEANLALGNYEVVQMACQRVQELEPDGGIEARVAQALLDLLANRYERALREVDAAIEEDPSIAYEHALRAYLLRIQGQDYDANLARARASRLSFGGRFENAFPSLETKYGAGYSAAPSARPKSEPLYDNGNNGRSGTVERDSVPTWSRSNGMNGMQRQMVRTRFALSQYPGLVTNALIAINVIVYLLMRLDTAVFVWGAQVNPLVLQGQYWRIFTAMFLHDPTNIFHIFLNMLSLFFIGRAVEIFYGKWRYLLIYLLSGILGGVSFLLLSPGDVAVGASGAIFGVFGALGVFYIINRRALGAYGSGAITNWIFWLVLNIAFGIAPGSGIAVWAHVGGLIGGMIISYLLIPRGGRGRILG
jgi:membrane associated rhomboid family serine protease